MRTEGMDVDGLDRKNWYCFQGYQLTHCSCVWCESWKTHQGEGESNDKEMSISFGSAGGEETCSLNEETQDSDRPSTGAPLDGTQPRPNRRVGAIGAMVPGI